MAGEISEEGVAELMLELEEITKKITDPNTKKEVLEAMAEPVVDESKRKARSIFGEYQNTGKLEDSIASEWQASSPDEIEIGWGKDGFYGKFHERGFYHSRAKRFIKNPHIRPAFEAKRTEVANAAIKKLKEKL